MIGDALAQMGGGFAQLAGVMPLTVIVLGVAYGILAGAMPGLSPSTAVALLVPFSYAMEPSLAIILLTSVYIATNYGGSITAVLINTPGTPAAAVTAFDGFPLTQKGRSGDALGTALVASTIGGTIGTLVLILFAVPLGALALKFGPPDYFALALFGLATIASLGTGNMAKALLATLLGLCLETVGMDPISGLTRFTFGVDRLYDGFNLIPALIGLFAVSVVLETAAAGFSSEPVPADSLATRFPSRKLLMGLRRTIVRSSLVGTIIGIFPGAGSTIASFISYDWAKRSSKEPERFGQGAIEGVAASEGANSASVGGALIPLLALGIPGSATDAVLLGAFMLHDMNPGPLLMQSRPEVVYGIFAALLIANVMILALGMVGNRWFAKVASIPTGILHPMILVIATIGSYAVSSSLFDVAACLGFGLVGFALKRGGYPVAPVVLGMVLGRMIEENFRRSVLMGGYGIFFSEPLSAVILLLTVASFVIPYWRRRQVAKAL